MKKNMILIIILSVIFDLVTCSIFAPDDEDTPDVLIVYSARNNEASRIDRDIMLTNFDGTLDRVLYGEPASDTEPQFNFTQDKIFFISDSGTGLRNLCMGDTAGTSRSFLTEGRYIQTFDVSPYDDWVVFSDVYGGTPEIFIYDVGTESAQYICQGGNPVFVDGGNALLMLGWSAFRNLRKVSLSGGDTLEITSNAGSTQLLCFAEERETFIVWTQPDNQTNYGYYILNNDGVFTASLSFGAGISGLPTLSPNGALFGYSAWSTVTSAQEVYLDQNGTGTPKQLTRRGYSSSDPVFFDDDNYLLYNVTEGDWNYLYHVDSRGYKEVRVSDNFFYPIESYDVAVY